MGISILELVLRRLREENFTADVAYPGQKYPTITDTVAAVHIEKVDRASLTVTVEVNILCPADMGGTACEVEALRATEVLRWAGAECVQNGCEYDGMAQVYCVSVLATFTCVTEEDDCTMGPGFSVYINDTYIPYAVSFVGEKTTEQEVRYGMGQSEPVGLSPGQYHWKITLEEQIPAGSPAVKQAAELFELRLEKSTGYVETYYHCRWTSEKRTYTREGLRRIRTGICMLMEET